MYIRIRDFPKSGSYYEGSDSGGECGVPYEKYFQMPVNGRDKPWYSIEHGPVHFTVMSTEHSWDIGSEQVCIELIFVISGFFLVNWH